MRRIITRFVPAFLLIAGVTTTSFSQSLDTLSVTKLAPGIEYYSIVSRELPLTIKVVKADLGNPGVAVRVVKASKDGRETLDAREQTDTMMDEANTDSTRAVAAINGGFFDMVDGRPMDLQIENGMIGRLPEVLPVRAAFLYGRDKKGTIGRFNLQVRLAVQDTMFQVNDVNQVCRHDQTILFDRFYGDRTGTNLYGAGIFLRPVVPPTVGGRTDCVVDALIPLSGNYRIPAGGWVVVARGAAGESIRRMVTTHDTVGLITKFTPDLRGITQAVAGWPMIVRDGSNAAAQGSIIEETIPGFAGKRHPRTSVGISKGGSELILAVVDGRTKKSAGVTLSELADLMLKFGAYDAVNLDGGGSSTMAINGRVVNTPSDSAGERPVSDALVITVSK